MTAKKKVIKVLAIVISVVIAVIAILVGKYLVFKHVMTNAAITYLCDKYSADKDKFKIVDYEAGRFHLISTDWIFEPFSIEWYDYKWELNYSGRAFFVNRINGRFYDDYQLDDIEVWATNWLKDNVNKHIIGIKISSGSIINYQCYTNGISNSFVFRQEDIQSFLGNYATYCYINESIESSVEIYIERDYFNSTNSADNIVLTSLKKKLPEAQIVVINAASHDEISKHEYKYDFWTYEYSIPYY